MKHAIACLNTQIGILLHNASVFHGEGREEDRDRATDEADDLRMAVEALRDEDGLSGIPISETPEYVEPQRDLGTDATHCDWVNPWGRIAKQYARNAEFYHGIVTRIGGLYGDAAKRCDDGTTSQDVLALVVPELVETSVNQFRLLAQFVGSKATSHTEIVSHAAAEIWALRTSLEVERQRRIDAERRRHVEETPKNRHDEPGYRMLEVGEMPKCGDQVLMADSRPDGNDWQELTDFTPIEPLNVGFVRRPIPLDTKPENPDTPAV